MTAMVMTACTGQQSDTASQNSDKEFNYVCLLYTSDAADEL